MEIDLLKTYEEMINGDKTNQEQLVDIIMLFIWIILLGQI